MPTAIPPYITDESRPTLDDDYPTVGSKVGLTGQSKQHDSASRAGDLTNFVPACMTSPARHPVPYLFLTNRTNTDTASPPITAVLLSPVRLDPPAAFSLNQITHGLAMVPCSAPAATLFATGQLAVALAVTNWWCPSPAAPVP